MIILNNLHNLIFPQLKGEWKELNLNEEAELLFEARQNSNIPNKDENPLLNPHLCSIWVEALHEKRGCDYSYGGYLEDRKSLWKGHYHKEGHTTHIGVDFNVPAYTEVYMPFDGELVAAENDPHQNGGWGTRVIFKVNDLYVIFAHLRPSDFSLGEYYRKGCTIGSLGTPMNNGGWFPHLHVQCMKNYDMGVDGYFQAVDNLKELFPNPYEI